MIFVGRKILGKFIFKEFSWYLFGQLLVQASSFISAIIVTRYLGPTNLGLLSFSQNFVSVLLSVLAGADFYLTWKIAGSQNIRNELQTAFAYKIRLHVLIAIIGSVVALVSLPLDVAILCLILFIPSILQSFSVFTAYSLARNFAKQTGILQAILAFIFLTAKCVGVYFSLPLTYFVTVAALDMVMFGFLMYLYCSWRSSEAENLFSELPAISFGEMILFAKTIFPSVVAIFFWGLLLRVDQFIIAFFTDAYNLGLYASAVKVAEMPNIVAGVITSALTSRIAQLPSNEKIHSQRKVASMLFVQGFFGVIVMFLLMIFAGPIITMIYGNEFEGSKILLSLYALTIPFMFLNYVFHSLYGSFSMLKFQALNYGIALSVNFIFGVAGYFLFGVIGVVIATVFAYALCTLVGFFYIRKTILY